MATVAVSQQARYLNAILSSLDLHRGIIAVSREGAVRGCGNRRCMEITAELCCRRLSVSSMQGYVSNSRVLLSSIASRLGSGNNRALISRRDWERALCIYARAL